jgi:hypothetical protein
MQRCGAAFALRPFVHGAAFLSAKTSVCGTFRTYATADNAGAEIPQSWLLPQQHLKPPTDSGRSSNLLSAPAQGDETRTLSFRVFCGHAIYLTQDY